MSEARASAILVAAAAVCFGTTGTAQALGGAGASALSLGAARVVFGGALLALIAVAVGVRGGRSGEWMPRPTSRAASSAAGHPLRLIAPLGLVVIGALGVAAYQPAFFTGTSQNGVAVGTLVALGSAPVLTGLLEWAVWRKAPGRRWAIATGVAALGVAALSGVFAEAFGGAGGAGGVSSAGGAGSISVAGLFASLAAGLCYAVYALSSKALLERGYSPTMTMGATFGVAALVMVPVLVGSDLAWLVTPRGALTVGWLAIVTTGLAYTLFARGLKNLAASRAATLTLIEPLTATALGIAVLHEQFTLSSAIGVALLTAGLAILTVSRRGSRANAFVSPVSGEGV
ncbi:DMT family transporter [Subtercola lobariae]|uniref:DMT family transporter n=1 Tax=Subtercola lobariae TaxID=1588641 RepID=UPI001E427D39|nr:EamA family transporter [Subtercola lobariae]